MSAAVFPSTLSRDVQAPSKLAQVAARLIAALVESRAGSAGRELRRHEALIADLGRRQDHSPCFLEQSDPLPFKI